MVGARRVVLADPVERRPDRAGDVDPCPLGVGCGFPVPTAEPHRTGQLVREELDLVPDPRHPACVRPGRRLRQILLQLLEPTAVARLRPLVQDRLGLDAGAARGGVDVYAAGRRVRPATTAQVERVELPARRPQQQRQIADALAVAQLERMTVERDRPVVALAT